MKVEIRKKIEITNEQIGREIAKEGTIFEALDECIVRLLVENYYMDESQAKQAIFDNLNVEDYNEILMELIKY